jgi:A/G-specific adenine glycosylase
LNPSTRKRIASCLLSWYSKNARSLPWRGVGDQYAIWVSEVMLQQTRIETVIPYYTRWMTIFPTLHDLAYSSGESVLQAWEGLGYYSRARNFQAAARQVLECHGGRLPDSIKELEKLPGVGRYTAGALASLVYGKDEPALDGNIRRVLARLIDLSIPARSPEGEEILWGVARELIPPGKAGDLNQALMDLGAMVCTPRNPDCSNCPLGSFCQARSLGMQEQRPVKTKKAPIPHITVAAAVIFRDQAVLVARRPANGLLGGLWEFPGGKKEEFETLEQALRREIHEELGTIVNVGRELGVFRHAYTHFRVTLHAFLCEQSGPEPQAIQASELRWVYPDRLADLPMGKIDRQISLLITGV